MRRGLISKAYLTTSPSPPLYSSPERVVRGHGVGNNEVGLIERPHQILAGAQIDCGFAAHTGVHLRKQAGRNLPERYASLIGGSGEAAEIANHAATQSHDDVVAPGPFRQASPNTAPGLPWLLLASPGSKTSVASGAAPSGPGPSSPRLVHIRRR